jgi:hypothetical protein
LGDGHRRRQRESSANYPSRYRSFRTEFDSSYELVDAFSVHSVDTLWQRLTALWAAVARALDPTPGAAPSGVSENAFVALALGAAKFERNLVAGIHAFQVAAL